MKAVYFFIRTLLIPQLVVLKLVSAEGVVCLYDSTDIEIKRNLSAVVKVYKDFEIISQEGAAYAELAVPINDYIEFSDLKGYTELRTGKKIKIEEKDYMILTGRMDREFGGKKAVLVSLKSPSVGARLHYQYRLDIENLLYLPRIVRNNSHPIERISVSLKWPRNLDFSYNYSGFEKIADGRSALFFADYLPGIPPEPLSCHDQLYLYLSADRFKFDGREYSCNSWNDVGIFYNRISEQPSLSLVKIAELADRLLVNSESLTDSLKVLFDFVADSVSYVALRIGSGDFIPHDCSQIIERGFGDCKDQSLLLTSLYRTAGMEAFPVLLSTFEYPLLESLHPWPAFFDHTLVAVKAGGQEFLLDPSDPLSDLSQIPPRLKGKRYLVVDGTSELNIVPEGPEPDEGIFWSFIVKSESTETKTDFVFEYINDAAVRRGNNILPLDNIQKAETAEAILVGSGWDAYLTEVKYETQVPDTFKFGGVFYSDYSGSDSLTGYPVGSPLVSHLIDNIFAGVRQSPYCRRNSLHLEEYVRLQNTADYSLDLSEYKDYWVREGLEFFDEMKYIGEDIVFRRVCDLDGREIAGEDFNAFRDFLISRKNQRYVFLPY
ncbi:MAG: DUF3857 domain-containing protein [Candidatus Zixiibacteriota bacterium]|nr:MAG: DUF3857 domain-containing protein [candidate division Zixibacteria bacterium]